MWGTGLWALSYMATAHDLFGVRQGVASGSAGASVAIQE